jgi:steroid 5-alpha reductase family enzyme
MILAAAVGLWGVRLGGFLFQRILNSPEDKRLSEFFPKQGELPVRLFGFWMLQATWAFVSLLPVTMAMRVPPPLAANLVGPSGLLCLGGFAAGFLCEAVADPQKSAFKEHALPYPSDTLRAPG